MPAYVIAETIQVMTKAGGLRGANVEKWADLESVVQKSFQFLLTILLGIHSTGVKRLNETYAKGLTALEDSVEPEDRESFRLILDRYKRSDLYRTVFKALEKNNVRGDSEERELTRLANEHRAINLSQGFPDFDCAPELVDAVARAMHDGHNQYAPMPGVLALREALAMKI